MKKYFLRTVLTLGIISVTGMTSSLVMADQEAYRIDGNHSFANWSIRHVASKTSGTFSDIKGKILLDRNNLENSSVEAKINVLSVNSSHAKRDEHIKKEEYLDAAKFSEMTFVSSTIKAKNNTEGIITGYVRHAWRDQADKLTIYRIRFWYRPLGWVPRRFRSAYCTQS